MRIVRSCVIAFVPSAVTCVILKLIPDGVSNPIIKIACCEIEFLGIWI